MRLLKAYFSEGKNIDDMQLAISTIDDGLRHGMTKPISEIETDYREAVRIIGVQEEDLSFLTSNSRDDDYIYRFRAGLIPMGYGFGYDDLDKHLKKDFCFLKILIA